MLQLKNSKLIFLITYVIVIFSGIFYVANTDKQHVSSIWNGDYSSFYAAAYLIRESPKDLYTMEEQISLQNKFFPQMNGSFHIYAYPPFLAFLMQPLTKLNPASSKITYIFIQIICALTSCYYLSQTFSKKETYKGQSLQTVYLFCLLLLMSPNLNALFGGQNGCINLLLISLTIYHQARNRMCISGFFCGLTLFKPQYGILLTFFYFLISNKRKRFVCGFLSSWMIVLLLPLTSLSAYAYVNCLELINQLSSLNSNNMSNSSLIISITNLIKSLTNNNIFTSVITGILILAVSAGVYRYSKKNYCNATLLIPSLVLLISPQTGFYDFILTMPIFISLFFNSKTPHLLIIISGSILSYALQYANNLKLGFSPLLFMVLGMIFCFFYFHTNTYNDEKVIS